MRTSAGLEEARAVAGVDDVIVTAKVGQMLVPLPEGASYLGFIFARGRRSGGGGAGAAPRAREIEFPHRHGAAHLYAVAHALAGPPAEPLVQMCDPAWGIAENTIGGRAPGKQGGTFKSGSRCLKAC